MGKWYRSGLTKGILVAFAHIAMVCLFCSLLWVLACPDAARDALRGESVQYEESQALADKMRADAGKIMYGFDLRESFETDGKFDGDKLVDIKRYTEGEGIDGENLSGLAYRLGDLKKWMEEGYEEYYGDSPEQIIVGKKQDGSYEYYPYSDFKKKVDDGEFRFVMESDERMPYEILLDLKNGLSSEGNNNTNTYAVIDAENKVRFTECWNYDGLWVPEKFKPDGAGSVLEIANANPEWNGKLEQAYQSIIAALSTLQDDYDYYTQLGEYVEGNTNLAYLYADRQMQKVYTNCEAYRDYGRLESSLDAMKKSGKYVVLRPKLADCESNIRGGVADFAMHSSKIGGAEDFVFAIALNTKYPIQDNYYYREVNYRYFSGKVGFMIGLGIISAAAFILILVWLTAVAGRRPEDEGLRCNAFDRLMTEPAAALVIGAWGMCALSLSSMNGNTFVVFDKGAQSTGVYSAAAGGPAWSEWLVIGGLMGLITCAAFLLGYLSLARRIKAGTLWKNSFLRWLLICAGKFFRSVPFVWKDVLLFAAFLLSQILLLKGGFYLFVVIGFAADAAALVHLVRQAVGRKRLAEGVRRISAGELNYKIPTEGLRGEQLGLAEGINHIGEGLDAAVEASIKNERLKTDLITNVSHDIKTPLTSIINYIDLLKRGNIQDPKLRRYLEIMESKAQRLKALTEDVVEASKVSSGNITLECMNLNLVEMVQQTSGEFSEKFAARGLKEIVSLPEGAAVIWADGRRMWRILENVYNNVAKYAMEGTRVYTDLSQTQERVSFSLKNISQQPLNISADELTERFIRGDISRSTEGSGLGLSIAKNLALLMGGTFDLYLDGDLFRVTISFPRMKK